MGLRRRRVPLGRSIPVPGDGPVPAAQRVHGRQAPARSWRSGSAPSTSHSSRSGRSPPDAEPGQRPTGGTIRVVYPYETIVYRYDNATNRYLRYLCPGVCTAKRTKAAHIDRADGEVVAPKNVVILRMPFGPLNDGHPNKYRLEAQNVGTGEAWISSNGVTVKGTWSKASSKAPTLLFGPNGAPISLTAGQTFVQVIAMNYAFDIKDGSVPGPGPSGSPGP